MFAERGNSVVRFQRKGPKPRVLNDWEKSVIDLLFQSFVSASDGLAADKMADGSSRITAPGGITHLERNLNVNNGALRNAINNLPGGPAGSLITATFLHGLLHELIFTDRDLAIQFGLLPASEATCLFAAYLVTAISRYEAVSSPASLARTHTSSPPSTSSSPVSLSPPHPHPFPTQICRLGACEPV